MKHLTKLVAAVLLTALTLSLTLALTACNTGDKFVIYNCADYIDESVLDEFEDYYFQKTGNKVRVVYSTFETLEEMMTKMDNGAKVDVICPSEYSIQRLIEKGYLQPLNKDNIATIGNSDPNIYATTQRIFSSLESEARNINDYYMPYMWGTVGILYNTDKVTEADLENDWGLLWNQANNVNLTKEIYMKDSIRESYLAAVLYLSRTNSLPSKYDSYTAQDLVNCVDDEMIEAVEAVLKTQKSQLKGYEVDNGKEDLARGYGNICLCWSGDAYYAMDLAVEADNGVELAYYEPDITNLFIDGWVITKNTANLTASELFLEFMNQPTIAMKNAMYIGYTSGLSQTAISASQEALDIITENGYDVEEYFNDPYIYPDASAPKYGIMKDFGSKEADIVNMWQRVKASS